MTIPRRPPTHHPKIKGTAPIHLNWMQITTYTATYGRGQSKVIVHSLHPPPALKNFSTNPNTKPKRLTKLIKSQRKVIVMARTKKRTKPVDVDELEGLEEIDELDELDELLDETDEDEEEDEDTDDEDEDEEDEDEDEEDDEEEVARPKSKKRPAKKATTSTKKKTTRAKEDGRVGTQEVADHFGTDARTLRMILRKNAIEKDEESSRYEWSSLKHPVVLKIGKLIAQGEAKRVKKESLDKVKESAAKKKSTKGTATKTTKTKKRRVVEEDDEDDE